LQDPSLSQKHHQNLVSLVTPSFLNCLIQLSLADIITPINGAVKPEELSQSKSARIPVYGGSLRTIKIPKNPSFSRPLEFYLMKNQFRRNGERTKTINRGFTPTPLFFP
jgi:hypothetical protein